MFIIVYYTHEGHEGHEGHEQDILHLRTYCILGHITFLYQLKVGGDTAASISLISPLLTTAISTR